MRKKNPKNEKTDGREIFDRRERIAKAAAEVFAEKGVEKATLDEIAERAGVGKGTIYRRIGSKDELVDFLLKTAAQSLTYAIGQGIKKKTDSLFQFKEAINALCDFYEENINLVMLLLPQCVPCAEIMQPKTKDELAILKDVFKTLENILQRAVKGKKIRSVNPHMVAKGLIYFLNPYFYHHLRTELNLTKSEIAQFTIDLFLDGIRR